MRNRIMADCEICTGISNKTLKVLYEDEDIIAALEPKPASVAHVIVMPKQHHTILEQVPDLVISKIGRIANKISTAIFESLNIQGTNVMMQNGLPAGQKYNHFVVNIIPRIQNDKLNLEWKTKQLSEEEMATVELKIKENTKSVGIVEKEKELPINLDIQEPEVVGRRLGAKSEEAGEEEENYLIKHLRRVP